MKYCILLVFTILLIPADQSVAQSISGEIIFMKNSMSKIVSKNTPIQKIADGFSFIEGPVWNKEGFLLFSDIPNNKIMKYTPGKGISVFLDNSGFVGSSTEADGPGSNGLTYDELGNLIICQHGARQVVKYDRAGNFVPVARQYGGKRLNSPNDAVVSSDGTIYFTDPPYGLPLNMNDPTKEMSFQGVFRIRKGNLELIDDQLNTPNGITFSPDEKFLYVTDNDNGKKLYYRYEVDENGAVGKKMLFFDASGLSGEGGPDGIKVDKKGNCYFTGPGGVLVINPKGDLLGIIAPPEQPANIGWGGKDGKTLFMTCRTGLYAIDLKIEGVLPMR
jgi:gluconolactonase